MEDKTINLDGIYGVITYIGRRSLWVGLTNLQGYWCLFGDFNVILFVHEYKGGILVKMLDGLSPIRWSHDMRVYMFE